MGCAVLQGSLFADAQESPFQAAKRLIWAVLFSKGVDLLMLRNRVSSNQACLPGQRKADKLMQIRSD